MGRASSSSSTRAAVLVSATASAATTSTRTSIQKFRVTFEGAFDVVILDPPYVSRDCLEAFWSFAAWLSRGAAVKVVLTSVVNRPWLRADWGLALTDFELRFTSKLCTPLRAFTDCEEVAARPGIRAAGGY